MKIGVQTFTIRKEQKKNIRSAFLNLFNLGIKNFEVARMDFTPQNALELKTLIDKYGIEITSIQVKPKQVFKSPEKIIEFCNITGCKNVVISMLPFKCILGNDRSFYKFIGSLDSQYDFYAERGITLAYHHHNWEYIKLSNGRYRMNELISKTKKIRFVHDTYWTARSGILPSRQIKEFGDRLLGIHLRDLTMKRRGIDVLSCDAAIGDGVIDFRDLLSEAEKVGCSYYVIEQKTKKPYSDIEKSFGYLKSLNI